MQTDFISTVQAVGDTYLQKLLVERELAELEEHFFTLRKQEQILLDSLKQKYGTGDINVETGEIQKT